MKKKHTKIKKQTRALLFFFKERVLVPRRRKLFDQYLTISLYSSTNFYKCRKKSISWKFFRESIKKMNLKSVKIQVSQDFCNVSFKSKSYLIFIYLKIYSYLEGLWPLWAIDHVDLIHGIIISFKFVYYLWINDFQ